MPPPCLYPNFTQYLGPPLIGRTFMKLPHRMLMVLVLFFSAVQNNAVLYALRLRWLAIYLSVPLLSCAKGLLSTPLACGTDRAWSLLGTSLGSEK